MSYSIKAAISSSISPKIILSRLYIDRPILWSVSLFCGKLYVLILCEKKRDAEKAARLFDNYELETVAASDLTDAILRLKERPFDMIIVETRLGKASGLSFLSEAHKRLPAMQRIVLETSPIKRQMEAAEPDISRNSKRNGRTMGVIHRGGTRYINN